MSESVGLKPTLAPPRNAPLNQSTYESPYNCPKRSSPPWTQEPQYATNGVGVAGLRNTVADDEQEEQTKACASKHPDNSSKSKTSAFAQQIRHRSIPRHSPIDHQNVKNAPDPTHFP